jgi:hypothetical protein
MAEQVDAAVLIAGPSIQQHPDKFKEMFMPRDAVKYKDTWLAKGSFARELYDNGKLTALDKHLANLDKEYRKLSGLR